MDHVKVVDRWEEGKTAPILPGANIRLNNGGRIFGPFFATVYVDDYQYLLIRV